MISLAIIIASVALALVYALAWAFVPGVRQQIEQPKHWFQDRLQQYDHACQSGRSESGSVDAE